MRIITVGDLKKFLASLPPEMNGMEVTFVMKYSFKDWIESIKSGHAFQSNPIGGLFAMWAARKLLNHMQHNSKWRADFQTAKVVVRKDGVKELRFGNIWEPLGLWFEGERLEETQIDLAQHFTPELRQPPTVRESIWQIPDPPKPKPVPPERQISNGKGIVPRDGDRSR
ncbi:MAG TPA: hypothetical protein VH639_28905 [Bryobacteraceae bacterium]|jgi:hypothetical protein